MNKIVVVAIFLGIGMMGMPEVCFSYDRDVAVQYALAWSDNSGGNNGVANTSIYYKYNLDCANFVSQCLIAGGIRFRSRSAPPPNDNTTGDDRSELETNQNTKTIKKDDMKSYSRVISGANLLPQSMLHARHGGALYAIPNLVDTGNVWNDLSKGDLFLAHSGTRYTHCMFISGIKNTVSRDIYYCAHTNWRRHKKAKDVVANWQTSGFYRIVCLKDAPIITRFRPHSDGNYIKYMYGNQSYRIGNNSKDKVGKHDIYLYITFDTDMKTSSSATTKWSIDDTNYVFAAVSGSGYTKGWWTNASSGVRVKNRTWVGRIVADDLPADKNDWFKVSIRAKAADNSYNDTDNRLDKYNSSSACTLYRIRLDTRKSSGKADK